MKFLAFVDLHGEEKSLQSLLKRAREPDIEFVVCAGDVSQFSRNLRYLFKQFNSLGKKTYFVPGNHEENKWPPHEILADYPWLVDLHLQALKIDGYIFLGYGGNGFQSEDAAFRKIARDWYGKYKEEKIVLVTHGPPFGTKVDLIEDRPAGNHDYRRFIERVMPKLVICGHLHETAGLMDTIGRTTVINPGWEGMVIELK